METRFLESFVAVVNGGSFAEAARKLNLTATAVAQRVRSLEAELGVILLMRVGQTVKPTEAGAIVFDKAGSFLNQLRDLRLIATSDTLTGDLRIGAISTSLTGLLPTALSRLVSESPSVEVHIFPGSSSELYGKVLNDELDAAIIMQPSFILPKVCEWTEIRCEPLVLLAAEGVDTSDIDACLATKPFIRYDRISWGGQQIDRYLRDHGIQPKERFELDALESIATLVNANLGVALVPDWAPPWPEGLSLQKLQIPDLGYARRIGILWSRSSVREKLIKLLIRSFS